MGILAGLTTYGVSSGIIIYGIGSGLIPEEYHFTLVIVWALAGLGLAYIGVLKGTKGD